jgi:hypothetical protein
MGIKQFMGNMLMILLLMYPVCIYATQATLFVEIMVDDSREPTSHDWCMWFTILKPHMLA